MFETDHNRHRTAAEAARLAADGYASSEDAITHERRYLTAIADRLADAGYGTHPVETVSHTYVPVLTWTPETSPSLGFDVYANWEGDPTRQGFRQFNIVDLLDPDHFPALPDGTGAHDVDRSVEIIVAHIRRYYPVDAVR